MATQQVELEFIGTGTLPQFLEDINAQVKGLGAAHQKVSDEVQADMKKTADDSKQISTALAGATQTVSTLGRSAASGLLNLDQLLQKAAADADKLEGALTEAERVQFTQVNQQLQQVAQAQGIVVREVSKERGARIDALVQVKAMTVEEGKLLKQTLALTEAFEGVKNESQQFVAELTEAEEPAKKLTTRIRELTQEAALAKQAGDEITYARATREAADLSETLRDTRDTIKALNPDDQAGAFGRLFNVLGNGVQAVGGLAVAFGVSDEAIQKAFFRLQSFVTGFQGAAAFAKDFKDTYSDLLRVLGLTTTATEASTAASVVDTGAKEAQAGATVELTGATTAANTATKGLWATFIASPLAPLLILLGAVGAAMAFLVGQTKDEKKAYSELVDEINRGFDNQSARIALANARKLREEEDARAQRLAEVATGKRKDAELTAEEVEQQRQVNKRIDDATIQAINQQKEARLAAFRELETAFGRAFGDTGNVLSSASEREVEVALDLLGLEADATAKEINATFESFAEDLKEFLAASDADIAAIQTAALAAANDRREKELADIKAKQQERKQFQEQILTQIEALEKQLADKLRALELEEADPRQRLVLEREAAEEEVAILERSIRRQIALRELGFERVKDLTERERNELADARIAEGGGALDTTQEEQLAAARLAIQRKFLRDSLELTKAADKERIALIADTQRAEQRQFEIGLNERAEALRKAGATEEEILAFRRRESAKFEKERAQEARDIEEQIAIARVEAIKAGGDQSAEAQRAAEVQILQIKLDAAQASLDAIGEATDAETRLRKAELQKTIAELGREIQNLEGQLPEFDLFKLVFGDLRLSAEQEAALRQSINQIGSAIQSIVASNVELRNLDLQNQQEANEESIRLNEDKLAELESQLEEERKLQEQGLANNVDATLAAIETTRRAEQEALAEKKRIQAEQQKLARQQVVTDGLTQASGLATGVANLIKTWSTIPFGLGLVSAFAQAALIASFFTGIKARLAAAATQQLFKGTKSVKRERGEPVGIDTVPAMLTEDEAVVPVKSNRKHRALVGAIIDDDFSKLTPEELEPIIQSVDLRPLLEGTGVRMSEKETREIVRLNDRHVERMIGGPSMDGVERRLDDLTDKVEAFRNDGKRKTTTERMPDGSVVIREPNHRTIIRK